MALTVSMTTDPHRHVAIATISGDAGHDDLIIDIAETLSAIADDDHLVVDITDTQHLDAHHLDQLLDHIPDHVIIVHPGTEGCSTRVVASLNQARQLLDTEPDRQHQGGEPDCTS